MGFGIKKVGECIKNSMHCLAMKLNYIFFKVSFHKSEMEIISIYMHSILSSLKQDIGKVYVSVSKGKNVKI